MDEDRPKFGAAMGQDDTVAMLTKLQERFERGEIQCAALRLFRPDGTWEDIVLGGTPEEQAAALADLQASHRKAH
jgi:hypothetical protein